MNSTDKPGPCQVQVDPLPSTLGISDGTKCIITTDLEILHLDRVSIPTENEVNFYSGLHFKLITMAAIQGA
jgi:hypothetical protein